MELGISNQQNVLRGIEGKSTLARIQADFALGVLGKEIDLQKLNIEQQKIFTSIFQSLFVGSAISKATPFEFYDYAVELKQKHGLETASIDSWKDLSHPYNEYGGYAQYLEVVLPYRNQIAEDNNLHLHTIIHPKLTEKVNGKREVPSPYSFAVGS